MQRVLQQTPLAIVSHIVLKAPASFTHEVEYSIRVLFSPPFSFSTTSFITPEILENAFKTIV